MRRIAIVCTLAAGALLAACDGDDDFIVIDDDDLTAAVTVVERTPEPTSAPTDDSTTPPASGDTVEVQGIIGSIDLDAGVIIINRLQGADVDRIEVGDRTEILSARGGSISLADLRVSDRIIATGEVEGGALVAARIEIGQVVPGADPGG